MKAARAHEIGKAVLLDQVEKARIEHPNDVLVKVEAVGLCASDLHAVQGTLPLGKLPIVIGHEGSGTVVATGDAVTHLHRGDRVCIDYLFPCGSCVNCLDGRTNTCIAGRAMGFDFDGTFSEFVRVPESNLIPIPSSVSFDQAAILGCAVVTPFHAMTIGNPSPGATVAIFGLGGVGFNAVQWSRVFGCGKTIVVDISPQKLSLARRMGADVCVDASRVDAVAEVLKATNGIGVDVAFDFAGLLKTEEQTLKVVRKGGRVVFVGIPTGSLSIDVMGAISNEIEIRTSIDHKRDELHTVIELLKAGRIDISKSITHRFSMDEVNIALETLDKKIGDPIRIILKP